jgi:RNA exonuclease 1
VTLINEAGVTIYDQLVMPENPILDYLTQYSGMTAARLNGVTTRLAEVQEKLKSLIDYNTILVGHSLENDMEVLKVNQAILLNHRLVEGIGRL